MVQRGQPVTLKLVLTPRQTGSHESGNVIAAGPGSDPDAGIVLIGGHLDSWDLGTGAVDDAAGVATTAAAATRIMAPAQPRPPTPLAALRRGAGGGYRGEGKADARGHTTQSPTAHS